MSNIGEYLQHLKFDVRSLFWWVIGSTVAWGIIPFLVQFALKPTYIFLMWLVPGQQPRPELSTSSYPYSAISVLMLGGLFGLVFGLAQWLVWRRHSPRAGQWFAATLVGLLIGTPLTGILLRPAIENATLNGLRPYLLTIAWVTPGLLVTFFQRLMLRKYFARTGWWFLGGGLTWPTALFYFYERVWGMDPRSSWAYSVMGIIFGLVSGISLLLITRRLRYERKGVSISGRSGLFPPGILTKIG